MKSKLTRLIEAKLRTTLRDMPVLKRHALQLLERRDRRRHSAWRQNPSLVRALPRKMTVAVTAACDQRCTGCRYGRDFMPGHMLETGMSLRLLEDASAAGVTMVRLYGGEPLLHPELPTMIRHSIALGMSTYVTTNGILLGKRAKEVHDAGLRGLTIGYYGDGAAYDRYVGAVGRHAKLTRSLETVRDRFGDDFQIQLNYLVMRPSCNLEALQKARAYCERFDLRFNTDLIHYSLPYFSEGPERELRFRPEDEADVHAFVDALLAWRREDPRRFTEPEASLRSIPDWLFLGPNLRIPCDAYKLLWVGADGTVQLCYVTFPLGNLHEQRLSDMLGTAKHHEAARAAFCLECPGCHCERSHRIAKDAPSFERYSRDDGGVSFRASASV